jgi:hypothetical protein
MKTHFVLIDYENVQPKDLAALKGGPFKVKVFVGRQQAKLSTELAVAIQRLGASAEYVQIEGSGRNALDFHIAFYIGHLAAHHADGHFHIISKDTGFDVLIKYLKTLDIECQRWSSLDQVARITSGDATATGARPAPAARASTPGRGGVHDNVDTALRGLVRLKGSRPRTMRTLGTTIASFFGKKIDEKETQRIIAELQRRGAIKIVAGKPSYELPE